MTIYSLCIFKISEYHQKKRFINLLQNRNTLIEKNNGYLISIYFYSNTQNERLSTVDFVTDKLQEISNSFSDKITVIREVHNQESPIFKNIFPKGKSLSIYYYNKINYLKHKHNNSVFNAT